MLSRIKYNLNQFLNQYDLDLSSRIFENSIPYLANLELRDQEKKGFHFTNKTKGGCRFTAPKLDDINKSKLFAFCNTIQDSKVVDRNMDSFFYDLFEISEHQLEHTILPTFKKFIILLHSTQADFFTRHQNRSKRVIGVRALDNIELLVGNIEINEEELAFKPLLKLIQTIKALNSNTVAEIHLLEQIWNDFKFLLTDIENKLINNSQYAETIKNIRDNFKLLLRVNPLEEVLKLSSLLTELNSFLCEISIYNCNIFPITLLALAGITNDCMPYNDCMLYIDDDDPVACITLRIPNLSETDAERFLKFFHDHRAITTKITECCFLEEVESMLMRDDNSRFGRYFVDYSIDSVEVKTHILPLFYAKINEMKRDDPSSLELYQKQSKYSFTEDAKDTVRVSEGAAFFAQQTEVLSEQSLVESGTLCVGLN